jgi:hypothetical protein
LGCKAWTVQVAPSSNPRQSNNSPINISRVTVLGGASRHDVSLPGRGPPAVPRKSTPCSGAMST